MGMVPSLFNRDNFTKSTLYKKSGVTSVLVLLSTVYASHFEEDISEKYSMMSQ